MKFILTLLAFAALLAGQSPALYVDLSGDWRFQTGDRPEYASAEFDDSAWPTIRLPRTGKQPQGYWWLRRTIDLPEWADTTQLAITIGGLNEVYEVYVNGILAGAIGGPSFFKTYTARPRTMSLPAGAVPKGARRIRVSLRLWYSGNLIPPEFGLAGLPDAGPYLLTYAYNAPHDAGRASMAVRERVAAGMLAAASIEFILGLLLLVCWLFQSSRRELAWFACFLLIEAVTHGWIFFTLAGDWSHGVTTFVGLALTLGPLFLLQFALPLINDGVMKKTLQAMAWLAFALHVVSNATQGQLSFLFPLTVLALMEAALCAVLAKAAILAWRQADRSAAVIPAGICLLALSWLLLVLTLMAGADKVNLTIYGIRWEFTSIATILIGTIFTIQLIRGLGAASERLTGEIEAARAIQQLLLPGTSIDSGSGFHTDTAYQPASEVGGDFYQTLAFPDGGHIVLVGDVSGKGLRAAMLVSVAIGALRRETSSSPAAVLAGLNQALAGHAGGGFVTCCCLRYEEGGRVLAASAGHPNPYLDGLEVELDAGLPLGISADAVYQEVECILPPGSQMTLVSDGVVEAENTKRELFGFDRTREISTKPAQEIADAAKAWGQTDDITVVTVRRTK